MKKGFSLIELMVVVAISAILLLVVTDFLIFTIQRNNQVTIENQVRGEANSIMDSVARDIRSSSCECLGEDSNSIRLYESSSCDCTNVTGPTPYAAYSISSDSLLQIQKNLTALSSNSVKAEYCSTCNNCSNSTSGLIISQPDSAVRSYVVTLSLRQAQDNPRSDFCGKVQIQQRISPRNK